MSLVPCPVCGRKGEIRPAGKTVGLIHVWREVFAPAVFCSYCGIVFHPTLMESVKQKIKKCLGLVPRPKHSGHSEYQHVALAVVGDDRIRPAFLPSKKSEVASIKERVANSEIVPEVKKEDDGSHFTFSIHHSRMAVDFQVKFGKGHPAKVVYSKEERAACSKNAATPSRRKILGLRSTGQKRFRSDFYRLLSNKRSHR